MKKEDLFIGVFPGGTMYCDRTVMEWGDYKQLCFVKPWGKISIYDVPNTPGFVLDLAKEEARRNRARQEEALWAVYREKGFYGLTSYLDNLSTSALLRVINTNGAKEKVRALISELEKPGYKEIAA